MFQSLKMYYLKPLVFLLGALSFLFSNTKISDSTFLFCLQSYIKPLQISIEDESFLIQNNKDLENFLIENHVINLEEWIPHANEKDRDGDIYLNRIYRAYIDSRMQNISSVILKTNNLQVIKYAENEFIRTPKYSTNDPLFQSQCSLPSVKAQKAWDFWDIPNGEIPQSRNVLLASVDTGVDYTHPDIQDNSWINQAEIPEWMAEAGLDSNSDGYIEASEVVAFLTNENMDVNSDGVIILRDIVSDGSPFEDGIDNDGNGYADD
jgi:subtilisin family serine protease